MRNKRKIIALTLTVAMTLVLGMGSNVPLRADLNSQQYEGVELTKSNFPDAKLRNALKYLDENKDGLISIMEQKNQEEGPEVDITVPKGKFNLKGISQLTAIEHIYIEGAKGKIAFENMDELAKCKSMKSLTFNEINTNVLNIEGTKNLKELAIYDSKIKNVKISDNKKLKNVTIRSKINDLKFGTNAKLKDVEIRSGVKKADVSNLKNLISLSITSRKLSSLDLSKNRKLTDLWINQTNISKINLKNNKKLVYLSMQGNKKIKTINLKKNTRLETICVFGNGLKKLNIKNQKKLKLLDCKNNKLKKIDLSSQSNLQMLDCSDNRITSLDLSKLKKLEFFDCSNNKLTKLNVQPLKKLFDFVAGNNKITEIDLSKCPELYSVELNNTKLTKIDISQNMNLDYLNIKGTSIKEVDVTNNHKMKRTNVYGQYAGYGVVCDKDVVLKANNQIVKPYILGN